jgi:uncharacterized protein
MVQIGQYSELEVVKEVDFGVYLDGGKDFGEILLPKRYVPQGLKVGQKVNVFVCTDSEDRIIATTEKPKALVGDFVFLKVVSVSSFGAFLDWGLSKDLLLPLREQKRKLKPGDFCAVKVYLDAKTQRVAASQKLDKFLNQTPPNYGPGQKVALLIVDKTDVGYSAVINSAHRGLLFQNEIFEPLSEGDNRQGFIKKVREDGKIDLTLIKPGYEKVDSISEDILNELKANGGFLEVTDKTPPEIIYRQLKMSKKTFKKAIGALYKKRLIVIEADGIRFVGNR